MMLFIFLAIIVLGSGLFGFVFMKEFKSGALGDKEAPVPPRLEPSRSLSAESGFHLRESDVQAVPGMETPVGDIPAGLLGERCNKLEQMLEEKNRLLKQAEQELLNERAHRGEFESFKEILQRQIEDLKAQNRRIKEDLSKALQNNIEQQAVPAAVEPPAVVPPAAPEAAENSSEKFEQFFNNKGAGSPALSLHDIFENKQKLI